MSPSSFWDKIKENERSPKRLTNHVCMLISAFLWKGKADDDGLPNVSWKKVCKPFVKRGQLRDLTEVKLAGFLGKPFWRVLSSKESLWVKWIHGVYILNHSIWHVQKVSWPWKCFRWEVHSLVGVLFANSRPSLLGVFLQQACMASNPPKIPYLSPDPLFRWWHWLVLRP